MPTERENEMNALWAELAMPVQNAIMKANMAAKELTKHRDRASWLEIGEGLHDIREEAKRRAGTESIRHPYYRRYYTLLLEKVPDLENLDEHDPAGCQHAVWMYENWEAVESFLALRAKANFAESLRALNHPSAIRRHFDAAHTRKPQGREKAPTKSKRQEARIDELQDEVRELRAELRNAQTQADTPPAPDQPTAPAPETPDPIRRAVIDQPTAAPRVAAQPLVSREPTVSTAPEEDVATEIARTALESTEWDADAIRDAIEQFVGSFGIVGENLDLLYRLIRLYHQAQAVEDPEEAATNLLEGIGIDCFETYADALHDLVMAEMRKNTERGAAELKSGTVRAERIAYWVQTMPTELAQMSPEARGEQLAITDRDVRDAILASLSADQRTQWEAEMAAALARGAVESEYPFDP